MLMTEETREKLNSLLANFFSKNSQADNIAYNLAFYAMPLCSKIYHKSFAHFFTGDDMADMLSDFMDLLDTRAERKEVAANIKDYNGDILAIFQDNLDMCNRCRNAIIDAIDTADFNGDYEVRIKMEELLITFMPYRKQADVWAKFAERYKEDYKSFDVHFADITTYIDIIE